MASTLSVLKRAGQHDNIVSILAFGDMHGTTSRYYIDMELCDMDLDSYIHHRKSESLFEALHDLPIFVSLGDPPQTQWINVAIIMTHISAGLSFLHANDLIHRSTRPADGTIYPFKCDLTSSSL